MSEELKNELPVVEEQATDVVLVDGDDGISTGHKVAFYVICGVVCLTIVGIPVLAFLYLRERKKVKMLTEAQAAEAVETEKEEVVVGIDAQAETTPEKKK